MYNSKYSIICVLLISIQVFFGKNVSDSVKYKNTLYTNTFIVPGFQTVFSYGRNISEKSAIYGGVSWLNYVPVFSKNANKDFVSKKIKNNNYSRTGLVLGVDERVYNTTFISNMGLLVGYRYALSKAKRRVRFYADANTNFVRFKAFSVSGYVPKTNTFYYHTTKEFNQLAFNLGITMKVKFLKRFYYYQNVGVGLDLIFENDLQKNQKTTDVEPYGQVINFGLGYNF